MSPESRERDRIRFQEVAKLATTPEPSGGLSDDTHENSGMIDLGALAAGEAKPRAAPQRPATTVDNAAAKSPALPSAPQGHPASYPSAWATVPGADAAVRSPGRGQTMRMETPASPLPAGPLPARTLPPPPRLQPSTMRMPVMAAPPPLLSSTPSLAPQTTRPTAMATDVEKKKGSNPVWLALAAGMGLGALVAAGFFQMRSTGPAPSNIGATPVAIAVQHATAASVGNETVAAAPAQAQGGDLPVVPAAPVADTSRQLQAAPDAKGLSAPSAAAVGQAPSTATATPATQWHAMEAATHAVASAAPTKEKEESLDALMKRAVGITAAPALAAPPPAAAEPPAPAAGNLPVKPAMGAVQGAVGTLLPAARYCLGPDDPISHATVTFQSDGSVQNVAISGAAAGQPAEGCIRSRLMAARVAPFSNPTFTWTVTVRPAS